MMTNTTNPAPETVYEIELVCCQAYDLIEWAEAAAERGRIRKVALYIAAAYKALRDVRVCTRSRAMTECCLEELRRCYDKCDRLLYANGITSAEFSLETDRAHAAMKAA